MNNDDFKRILKESLRPLQSDIKDIKKTQKDHSRILDNHSRILDNHSEKLSALWEQTVKLTEEMEGVKDTVKSQATSLDQTDNNVKKISKRLTTVEDSLGTTPPPELTINS